MRSISILCRAPVSRRLAAVMPGVGVLILSLAVSACRSPTDGYDIDQVRRDAVLSAQRELEGEAAAASRGPIALPDADDSVLPPPEPREVDPGESLDDEPARSVPMSLAGALRAAVSGNLDVRFARLRPSIREQQVTESQAAFDPSMFAEYSFQQRDEPIQGSSIGGIPTGTTLRRSDNHDASVGLTKTLRTGGEVSLSTGVSRTDDDSPDLTLTPDPGTTSRVAVSLSHPLLRNFGEDVNTARIRLSVNAKRRDELALRGQMLSVVAEVESAYWQLVFAWRRVAIREHTLAITLETQRELEARERVDVSPLQLAQAASFVQQRESDLIDARRALRDASDRIKLLMQSDRVPLADEAVVLPTDPPGEPPIAMTAAIAIRTGLDRRPEIDEAALQVADASIRVRVADNQRLPVFNLRSEVRLFGLEKEVGGSYGRLDNGDFIDYVVGARFERPLGNRAAEAAYRRERLTRQTQTIRLKRVSQDVVLSVKQAMRAAQSASRRIATTRRARAAAEENLRTLEEREKNAEALTPEFLLDLKLNTQQRLAEAQLREIEAIASYNASRARFLAAVGTLLDERGIEIEPHGDDAAED